MARLEHPRGWRLWTPGLVAGVVGGSAAPGNATAAPDRFPHRSGTAEAPTDLRVDGQASDALVGAQRPTFAWTVNDSGRAEAQTAYEIRVDGPRRGGWDSGRVVSPNSTDVAYPGPALL